MYNGKILINGKLIDSEKRIDIFSPIDNEKIGSVPSLKKEDIDYAYLCAKNAFNTWKDLDCNKRIEYINRFKTLLKENQNELATLLTKEVAKPFKQSLDEINRSIEYIDATIQCYLEKFTKYDVVDESIHNIKNKVGYFYREPLGVVLCISPFNYPINLSISKFIPALLVGNSVVLKPATQGSLTTAFLADLLYKSNFPEGVMNVVTGKGSEIGDYLVENKNIGMISFTGSANVGNDIAKKISKIPLVLEQGGKDPAIVLDDCNINKSVDEIIKGAFSYSGQRCTAIKIVYVDSKIADNLVSSLKEKILTLKIDNPFNNPDIVPLISKSSLEYAKELILDAKSKQANIITGDKYVSNMLWPTLIDHVDKSMDIFYEEQFSPILPIVRFDNIDDVINSVNNSKFGLQASIFTTDNKKGFKIAKKLNVGTININKSSSRGPDVFPFLGVRDSGFGVQGIYYALESMTRIKGIVDNN